MSEYLHIKEEDLRDLEEKANWLECLEAAGVDNWEGYDFARDIYAERYGDDA